MSEEKKKSKIKIDPYVDVSNYKQTPQKDVKVGGTQGRYGVQGEVDLGKGFKVFGRYEKSFDKGKVKYPGGSESWNAKIPDNWNVQIKYSKKFGKEAKPDLSKLIDDKSTGGLTKKFSKGDFVVAKKDKKYYKDIV